jgi:hypothetical protein
MEQYDMAISRLKGKYVTPALALPPTARPSTVRLVVLPESLVPNSSEEAESIRLVA